jgi:hypothetical protein
MDFKKKLKKLQHSKLPNLVSQIKLLKDEINAFKSAIQTYKEITKKNWSQKPYRILINDPSHFYRVKGQIRFSPI